MLSNYFLEEPWRITFDTNPDQCNLHCIMCEIHSKYNTTIKNSNRVMDFDVIKQVLSTTTKKNLKEIIPSTMGEPLLYNRFIDLIELLKEFRLKLNLTTNGTFPRLGVLEWSELILPIASDIKISIGGVSKEVNESIMEGINFEKQMANIQECIKIRDRIREAGANNPTITFQVTFMEKNINEMPNLLKTAIALNVDRFKGHHLWITHPELENQTLKKNRTTIRQWNEMVDVLFKIAEKERLINGNKIKLDNIYYIPHNSEFTTVTTDFICPFLGREAWIAWDGTFNVCCAPDELRKSLGSFGNVTNEKFINLWKSQKYNDLVKNWGHYEVCQNCNMRRPIKNIEAC